MLTQRFDSVVMLTMSNWHTELRSNRYHYASRFAKHLRVIFVQCDRDAAGWESQGSEIPNIEILHLSSEYGPEQSRDLYQALAERGIRRPLLWIYNPRMSDFIANYHAPLKVFHATEDFFRDDFLAIEELQDHVKRVLKCVDLNVAVTDGVFENCVTKGGYRGRKLILTNGVDLDHWILKPSERTDEKKKSNIAVYQGNLNAKIDLPLFIDLAKRLPHWTFKICGRIQDTPGFDWQSLLEIPNVVYRGVMQTAELIEEVKEAKVGLIPFLNHDWLVVRSFPLKALEYAAAGLKVVSTPIDSLKQFEGDIVFANSSAEFAKAMNDWEVDIELPSTSDLKARFNTHGYDHKFRLLVEEIDRIFENRRTFPLSARKNLLILFDPRGLKVSAISEHLEAFDCFSRHRIFFMPASGENECDVDLSMFDAVIVHYSLRTSEDHINPDCIAKLTDFPGLKILFIQDEYDCVNRSISFIQNSGIHIVFTCVPEQSLRKVYPEGQLGHVTFVPTLTGYVSEDSLWGNVTPIRERKTAIAYRGRDLPYWYGDLGQEKAAIGVRFKEECRRRGISEDIEWTSDKRIYGPAWKDFLISGRCTLGTESGANVFDFDGSLHVEIAKYLEKNPAAPYAEVRRQFLEDKEGEIVMNQVSPKMFEAIAAKTVLVMFEGQYSGLFEPDKHFISVKKDYSNLDEVFTKIDDLEFLQNMADTAYRDIIESGKFSYQTFVSGFDAIVDANMLYTKDTAFMNRTALVNPSRKAIVKIGDFGFAKFSYLSEAGLLIHPPNLSEELIVAALRRLTFTRLVIRHWILKTIKVVLKMISLVLIQSPNGVEDWVKKRLGRTV